MNAFLWILRGLLAVVFTGSGVAKATMTREWLIATGQTGVAVFPTPVVRVGCHVRVTALAWADAVGQAR
jgi:hypothetical protein